MILDTGETASGDLLRHLAPLTISTLLRSFPFEGRTAYFNDEMIYWPSNLVIGAERLKSELRKGDIAFIPASGAVAVFLKDTHLARPVIHIGRLSSDVTTISRMKPGSTIRIEEQPA